ncbi:MAG: hypothetical protein FJZ04_03870 [Candidatus Moranbacteria bacterium]|nr:hypothetical protein [Candidatus Moranbacteria bacterium]
MDIEIGSRAHRVFFGALGICETFNDRGYYTWKFRDGTNLCHYCRVVFFYVPLIFVAQILLWSVVACTAFFLPVFFWGFMGWGKFVLVIICAIVSVTGGFWLSGKIQTWRYERRQRKMHAEPKPSGHPSQIEIAKEWVLAKKSKICPEIRFTHGKEATQ